MSLKTLLAVGESFSGTRMTPYEVKTKKQIPVFGTPENQGLVIPQGGTATKEEGKPQTELEFEKKREGKVKLAPDRRLIEEEPQERRRFLDRRWRGAAAKKLTQAEMTLEQVQVVRNDLSDSDLELAPRRGSRPPAETDLNPFAPRPIAAIGRPAHEKSGMGERVARWFRFLKKPRA